MSNYLNKMQAKIRDLLIDKLYNYEDQEFYVCELDFGLLQAENIDGTVTYSTFEAQKWFKEHFFRIAETLENMEDCVKPNISLIFDNMEKFMVIIYIEEARNILNMLPFYQNNYDEQIVLNKENIEILETELRALEALDDFINGI